MLSCNADVQCTSLAASVVPLRHECYGGFFTLCWQPREAGSEECHRHSIDELTGRSKSKQAQGKGSFSCPYSSGLAAGDETHIMDGSSSFTLSDEENLSQECPVACVLVDLKWIIKTSHHGQCRCLAPLGPQCSSVDGAIPYHTCQVNS